MIIDLQKFINEEQPYWSKLESYLDRLEKDSGYQMRLDDLKQFHYLYQRVAADLAKVQTFSAEPEIRQYLGSLVGRAYGEIHEIRKTPYRIRPLYWFFNVFPQTIRRHAKALGMSILIMVVGSIFGAASLAFDPESKEVLMPFSHLMGDPSERVAEEESQEVDRMEGAKATFSSYLMTHNIKVSIFTFALGMTWGVGTIILLFYNGVILGAVAMDYILAGESVFLVAWLLPHGSIEIPAILIAGQAGLIVAKTLIGKGQPLPLRVRFRQVSSDLTTLLFGLAIMLVWAGLVESFLSQYHAPVVPYIVKIVFGMVELILLIFFVTYSGKKEEKTLVNRNR